MTDIHGFKIGKAYRTRPADSPKDYLDTALKAEKYIASTQVTTEEGIYWQNGAPTFSFDSRKALLDRMGLYGGSSGILYFYLKLYEVTKEESFLDIVKKAASYICAKLPEAFPPEIRTLSEYGEQVSLDAGILGVSGIGFVLTEVYECFHWNFVETALHAIKSFYLNHSVKCETETYWTGTTTMITDTGIILFLLKYDSLFPSEELHAVISSAGEWFLSVQIPLPDGTIRYAGLECVWEGIKPNFEVGTAGSGFLLARLYEWSKDSRYLDIAEKCAAFLHNCKIPQSDGALIPFRLDQGADSPCYLGTCSGPAGTCRFFYLLYRLTGKQSYLEEIHDLVAGMESCCAPEKQSAGLWYTLNFCCGHAGLLQFFIGLYQAEGDEHILALAQRTANVILGEAEKLPDDMVRWHIAFERVRPEALSTPIGYYTGAAGIASTLLQLYLTETDRFHWKRFIDDPFPEEKGAYLP